MLRESLPDIIVSDLKMPSISGFDFLSIVQTSSTSIYLIHDGKIAEEWAYWDAYGLLQQWGVIGARQAA
jgi:DNA-binding response OmpR family regulator